MNKRLILGASLITLLAFSLLIAGCGGGGEDTAAEAESAAPAEEAAPAAETATDAVAVHDCAGGCGMKGMPEDKMTEIDGKFYCAGCAKKVQAEGHGEG